MLTTRERHFRDLVMGRRRHDDGRGVHDVQQILETIVRAHAKLARDRGRAIGPRLEEPDQPGPRYVAQNADVVVAERTGPDDADAHLSLLCHELRSPVPDRCDRGSSGTLRLPDSAATPPRRAPAPATDSGRS